MIWRSPLACMLLSVLLGWALNANAQLITSSRYDQIVLPANAQRAVGLSFKVDIPKSSVGVGYFPIKITVTSKVALPADRNFTIRLTPKDTGHSPPQNAIAVDYPFTVQQGTRTYTSIEMLPKWSVGSGYVIEVLEDGDLVPGHKADYGLAVPVDDIPIQMLGEETATTWLQIVDSLGNVERSPLLERATQQQSTAIYPNQYSGGFTGSSVQVSRMRSPLVVAAIPDAPVDWRQYSGFDGVLIAAATLRNLQANSEAATGLRDWVMSGGTLVVTSCESKSDLAQTLEVDLVVDENLTRQLDAISWGMQGSKHAQEARIKSRIENFQGQRRPDGTINEWAQKQIDDLEKELAAVKDSYFRLDGQTYWAARVGSGRVVGMTASYSSLDNLRVATLARMFGTERSTILTRGVDPILGDIRANQWLIPGVAQPPVYTFMGLLTVFVVLVGPIAYRKTTKAGRSHLMFAIAPILALLTTISMFAYGVVADGFGTQARVRQLTFVDGKSGDSFERIRGTYFAGIGPSAPLEVSPRAELVWYRDNAGKSWQDLNELPFQIATKATISAERQAFDSSVLPSRSQVQFVVHQPRPRVGKLKLVSSGGGAPALASTMDILFQYVVICDEDGVYWLAEQVPARADNAVCKRVKPDKVSQLLGQLYNAYRPLAETREGGRSDRSNSGRYRIRDLKTQLTRATNSTGPLDGVFEAQLYDRLVLNSGLANGMFVGLADVSDDVLLVEEASTVKSVRYVMGTLAP